MILIAVDIYNTLEYCVHTASTQSVHAMGQICVAGAKG